MGRIILAQVAAPAVAAINSRLSGAQSQSFRDRPLDEMIAGMVEIGPGECELWQGHVQPRSSSPDRRAELRKWRTTVPLDYFTGIRRKCDDAGIFISAYNYSFRDDFTNEEIERGFEMARALSAKALPASPTVSVTRRVVPAAAKYKMMVGMHGHDNLADPNEFARPESFEAAIKQWKWIGLNPDIGHFIAAGYDALPFLKTHYSRTMAIHIKDRKKNQGPNVPWAKATRPSRVTLELLKARQWNIPVNIEYAYKGADTITEVKRRYAYCKTVLAA